MCADVYVYVCEIEQSAGSLLFKTGGTTERMRIDSSGNVGIGNDAPSSLLSVGKVPTHTPGSVFTSSPSSFFSTVKCQLKYSTKFHNKEG